VAARQGLKEIAMMLPAFEAIDTGYLDLSGAASVYCLSSSEGPVLIETGTQSCLPRVQSGLRERGIDPASIGHVFVTHIHLDHAGAAGAFAATGAIVHAHPFGAPHLIDPAKLIASSRRVHGSAYERFYGDPVAAPSDRVRAEPAGARIDLGSIVVEAVESPGHARHHHAWLVRSASAIDEAGGGLLFTGDAAATLVPGSRFIGIPTPPPEYDCAAWLTSIERMRARRPAALVLTHGGRVDDASAHFDAMRIRLVEEDAWLRDAIGSGESDETILERYRAWLHAKADAAGVPLRSREVFIGTAWMAMNLAGARRAIRPS